MTTRLATVIGARSEAARSAGGSDAIRIREPVVGAEARTKGSLYLLAQVGGAARDAGSEVEREARDALVGIEREHYYDLTAGVPGALRRALVVANQRLYHRRQRLGIPTESRIGLVALAIHGRQAHVARLGSPTALLIRGGKMYELPPPAATPGGIPRASRRRLAMSAGEALDIEPLTWQGPVAAGDRIALVSRQLARVVGALELRRALERMRPPAAVDHLHELAAARGQPGADGVLVVELGELPATEATHTLEPVHPAHPLAGLPDESPVPLADAIGRGFHVARQRTRHLLGRVAGAASRLVMLAVAFVPRRRPHYPSGIRRTDDLREGRRRKIGGAAMAGVAALAALGGMVAGLPSPRPTDAIPRAAVAAQSIAEAAELLDLVEERLGGADLLDREPDAASAALAGAAAALDRAVGAGIAEPALTALRSRAEGGLDRLHGVTRIDAPRVVADLGGLFDHVDPVDMVSASDGSLWVLETGRGRVIRVDPATGDAAVVYRAGHALPSGEAPGDPWLIATAATDVVVIDRDRLAWRIDLAERVPRRMVLEGIGRLSPETRLIAALQHRPPLEIFTLYAVDGASGEILRWTPPPFIPVEYPDAAESYLSAGPDLDARDARDLRLDANAWLLQADTVTRVDFGTPRGQDEYSLDPPPDADLRPVLDYRLLDGATVGDRDLLYVYDAGAHRLIAFQRADGAFLRQWMAPDSGPANGALGDVRGLSVASVVDGPPVVHLLTADGVVSLVLE